MELKEDAVCVQGDNNGEEVVNDDEDTKIGEKDTPRIKEDAVELREDATWHEGRKEGGSKVLLDQYSSSQRVDTPK